MLVHLFPRWIEKGFGVWSEHTHTHARTHARTPEGGTYNTHPGGSVGSSSARPAPRGTPRSSAQPRCLSFQPGSGWCWTRWTSSRCPAGTQHLESETEREWEDERTVAKKKKKKFSVLFSFSPRWDITPTAGEKERDGGKEKKKEETLEENTEVDGRSEQTDGDKVRGS